MPRLPLISPELCLSITACVGAQVVIEMLAATGAAALLQLLMGLTFSRWSFCDCASDSIGSSSVGIWR